jgi:tRNA A37 threonylcarbamoyladenosine dehydratase
MDTEKSCQTHSCSHASKAPVFKPLEGAELENYTLHRRFDRMGRLVGDTGMQKLFKSRVMIVGLGGVGSWAAEALARSGVGELVLVDFDDICVTNANRQLHAMQGVVGEKKVDVMAERILKINPKVKVTALSEFYNEQNSERILAYEPDYIVDAIDNVTRNVSC